MFRGGTLKPYQAAVADWSTQGELIRAVRQQVFIREQKVPEALEWDGLDPYCVQVLTLDAQRQAIATARMTDNGHIGRMAVLAGFRGRGIGSAMLQLLIQQGQSLHLQVFYLNAQTHAVNFYIRHGFEVRGEEFMDAGIPHLRMEKIV